MTLCDAGPLLALVDKKQPKHVLCRKAVTKLSMPLVTTWACFSEAMYLALQRGGWVMQNQLGKLLLEGMLTTSTQLPEEASGRTLTFYEIQVSDYRRLFELIKKYRDRPMDLADATLVVAAERLYQKQIFTLDSDFLFYLINDFEPFDIVHLE